MAGTRCGEPSRFREGRSLEDVFDTGPAAVARREEQGCAVPVVLPDDPVAPPALALQTDLLGLAADREEEPDVVDDPPRRHDGPCDLRHRDVLHHGSCHERAPRAYPFASRPPPAHGMGGRIPSKERRQSPSEIPDGGGMTGDHFDRLADYYDILHDDVDYAAECALLEEVFSRYMDRRPATVLDLGCGTGNHARILATLG